MYVKKAFNSNFSTFSPQKRKNPRDSVPLIMLYKVVLTFESVEEIHKCDHLYEGH